MILWFLRSLTLQWNDKYTKTTVVSLGVPRALLLRGLLIPD